MSKACHAVTSMCVGISVSIWRAKSPSTPGSCSVCWPIALRASGPKSIAYHGAHSEPTTAAAPATMADVRDSLTR